MMNAQEFKTLCDKAEGYIELGLLEDAQNILEDLPTKRRSPKKSSPFTCVFS